MIIYMFHVRWHTGIEIKHLLCHEVKGKSTSSIINHELKKTSWNMLVGRGNGDGRKKNSVNINNLWYLILILIGWPSKCTQASVLPVWRCYFNHFFAHHTLLETIRKKDKEWYIYILMLLFHRPDFFPSSQQFLEGLVDVHGDTSFWIGCVQTKNNTCRWRDGIGHIYTKYNAGFVSEGGVRCIELSAEHNFAWDRAKCIQENSFICQQGKFDYTVKYCRRQERKRIN